MARAGAIRAGRAFVEIFADSTQLNKGLRRARGQLARFAASVKGIGASIASGFQAAQQAISSLGSSLISLGTSMTALGIVGSLGIKKAVDEFVSFDNQMLITQGILGETAEDMERLRKRALDLGKTTSFTATEVAAGMTNLARAGRDTDAIYTDIASAMNIARGTMIDMGQAAQILVNVQSQFGLLAGESERVADTLVATVNKSQQTIEDLGYAMKFVGPIANQLGLSLEETATALGLLADAGLRGTVGGTQLARVLKELFQPNKQKLLENMGLTLESEGRFVGFISLFEQLRDVTKDMSGGERVGFFQGLFGRGGNVAGILTDNIEKFEEAQDKMLSMRGIAKSLRETMESQLGGAFLKATSAISNMAIEIAKSLAPALMELSDSVTDIFRKLSSWVKVNREVVVSIAKAIVTWTGIGLAILGVGFALRAIGAAMAGFGQIVKLAFLPATIAIGAFVGLIKIAIPAALLIAQTAFTAFSAAIQTTMLAFQAIRTGATLAIRSIQTLGVAVLSLTEASAAIIGFASAVIPLVAAGGVVYLVYKGFENMAAGISAANVSIVASLHDMGSAFKTFFGIVRGGFSDISVSKGFEAIKNDAISTYNAITMAYSSNNMEDALQIALTGAQMLFKDFLSWLTQNGFVKLFDNLVVASKFGFGAMVIEAKEAFNKIANAAATLLNPIAEGLRFFEQMGIIKDIQRLRSELGAEGMTAKGDQIMAELEAKEAELERVQARNATPMISPAETDFDAQRRALAEKHEKELQALAGKRYDAEMQRQLELGALREKQEQQVAALQEKIGRQEEKRLMDAEAEKIKNAQEEARVRGENERKEIQGQLAAAVSGAFSGGRGTFSAAESNRGLLNVKAIETLVGVNENQLEAIQDTNRILNGFSGIGVSGA